MCLSCWNYTFLPIFYNDQDFFFNVCPVSSTFILTIRFKGGLLPVIIIYIPFLCHGFTAWQPKRACFVSLVDDVLIVYIFIYLLSVAAFCRFIQKRKIIMLPLLCNIFSLVMFMVAKYNFYSEYQDNVKEEAMPTTFCKYFLCFVE